MKGLIHALYIYPIKSCAGIKITTAQFTPFGIKDDRQWMIVDENGKMLTQRTNSQLALIQPVFVNDILWLQYPGVRSIPVITTTNSLAVSVWKDTVTATVATEEVNNWLSRVLNSQAPLALVRFNQTTIRKPGNIERFGETGKHFADASPFLIANKESLNRLNRLLLSQHKPTVDIRSFRPNVVVSGLSAFFEHELVGMQINGTDLTCVDHCERCNVITIDPDTAIKHDNMVPYKELSSLNSMPNNINAAAFGVNAIMRSDHKNTIVSVNDKVEFCLHV